MTYSIHLSSRDSVAKREEYPYTSLPGVSVLFDEYNQNIVQSAGRYYVLTHTDITLLQIFLWKQFGTISSETIEFKAVEMVVVEIDGELVE